MNTLKFYKTRYPQMEYAKVDTGLWMVFYCDPIDGSRSQTGLHYHSRIELLSELQRFATEYGVEATQPKHMNTELPVRE